MSGRIVFEGCWRDSNNTVFRVSATYNSRYPFDFWNSGKWTVTPSPGVGPYTFGVDDPSEHPDTRRVRRALAVLESNDPYVIRNIATCISDVLTE